MLGDMHWPAEWHPHDAVWLAWPHLADEWDGDLSAPKRQIAALARAIADVDDRGRARGESIHILVPSEAGAEEVREQTAQLPGVTCVQEVYGDIWMRDTGPLFLSHCPKDRPAALVAKFNGWGGRYMCAGDNSIAEAIATRVQHDVVRFPAVLEGGAIESDGEGTILTTQVLNLRNRNPQLSRADANALLQEYVGAQRVVWLEGCLENDHTDGHIDTLARFCAPGHALCMRGLASDPNARTLAAIEEQLRSMTDARGRRLRVTTLPSPGAIRSQARALLPASYLNFFISNTTVIVPTYNCQHDTDAIRTITAVFPSRRIVGLDARCLVAQGGAFHCITQPQFANATEDRNAS